ncbi:response regulator [Dendrosporobacter sp. 1207_IL3150]|uniref:response regulator n=1 Tax=Dendrosporobacter sp. 1207_IL3150 TaxID=3084054 RepID=UPI002FD90B48
MAEKIRVLIADDVADTRENIDKLMAFHPEVIAVGQAATAEEAITLAKQVNPDIILMDINMPGMDGITATEIISGEVPNSSIIIMSVQGEPEYFRRAMVAGAKNYLVKPFTGDELLNAVKQVNNLEQKRKNVSRTQLQAKELGKVITVFSTKGGVGKTTIATNLAVALAEKTGAKVGLIDGDLQFGDVALFLNLLPQATIADLVKDIEHLDEALMEGYLTPYNENLQVLPAPFRPEQADTINGSNLSEILKVMRQMFDYIIVDTAPAFNDTMLTVLDAADQILVVSSMDLPTIKNIKLCLEIMESLNYSDNKVKVILNRANSEGGMEPHEVEESLHCTFAATLPSEGKTVVPSVNKGIPFVISHPNTPIGQGIFELARSIAAGGWKQEKPAPKSVVERLKRLFG